VAAVPLLGESLDLITLGFALAVVATVFMGRHAWPNPPLNEHPSKTRSTVSHPWTLAQRAHKMNPSVIREILKVTEKPGIISFAGGLPSPRTFPVEAFAEACERCCGHGDGRAALQYAASEGLPPLREWVAASLPWAVDPAQVLITTGSQQGLDLVAKVLIDEGSRVLVETPTYLGALQAFTPMEPVLKAWPATTEVWTWPNRGAGARSLDAGAC
jgi:DNA-binding transcriptional MocR family regulator